MRVDSDTIDRLIRKTDGNTVHLDDRQKEALQEIFTSQLPGIDKVNRLPKAF